MFNLFVIRDLCHRLNKLICTTLFLRVLHQAGLEPVDVTLQVGISTRISGTEQP